MEVSGQLHIPAALPPPPGKSPWCPLDTRLGGTESRTGRSDEEKNSQPLPNFEPPIIQPVAQRYTAELTRLRHWTRDSITYKMVMLLSSSWGHITDGVHEMKA
jgi:hypothetical protein